MAIFFGYFTVFQHYLVILMFHLDSVKGENAPPLHLYAFQVRKGNYPLSLHAVLGSHVVLGNLLLQSHPHIPGVVLTTLGIRSQRHLMKPAPISSPLLLSAIPKNEKRYWIHSEKPEIHTSPEYSVYTTASLMEELQNHSI